MTRVIAIDGPSGSGKSSTARRVGAATGFLHVDSGALYRIMTWQSLVRGVDPDDAPAVAALAAAVTVEPRALGGEVAFFVDGERPDACLRTPEVNARASKVSAVPALRGRVTAILRSLTALGDLVVEGRDITTVVFADSPARFFLTASASVRALRRQREEVAKGIANQTAAQVEASLLARDRIDSTRSCAPLRKADGAFEIDSSSLTLDEVVRLVLDRLPPDWRRPSL